jgi:uncharacterized protein YecE (DUF72 family)
MFNWISFCTIQHMVKKIRPEFRVGCSGYYYRPWKGTFYPEKLPASKWLEYYSSIFNTIELNGTFYRTPKLSDLKRYITLTPDDFTFSVKVSRYITHILKLKETATLISEFKQLIEEGLGNKLENLLFQLPPSFVYNEENLETLILNIPPSDSHVIEFRHLSWWNSPKAGSVLKKSGYTFCNVDYPGIQEEFIHTSNHFYLRMHGVPELFKSTYSDLELQKIVQRMPENIGRYNIYFNNTFYDGAYKNALTFIQLLNSK